MIFMASPPELPLVPESNAAGQVFVPSEMEALLAERPDLEQTMRQLLGEAVRSTCSDAAALVLATDGVRVAALASEEPAAETDLLQWELAEGPGLESLRSQLDFMTGDVGADTRWPHWGPRAAAIGWLSVVSKRLSVSHQCFGALNLYSRNRDAFGPRDLEVAEFFARYASLSLAGAHERDALLTASQSRQTIGIAEGILMQRHALDPEAAFTRLRQRGRKHHTTLLVAAQQIASEGPGRTGCTASRGPR
jgi:GAF domain-containing protein